MEQEESWLIGEAVTDPLVHLPGKFTALKLLFLDAFSPEWMSSISNTCIVVAVSEPNIKPGQLKRIFTRMFLQLCLLFRWITWGCHFIACFLFCLLLLSLFQTILE